MATVMLNAERMLVMTAASQKTTVGPIAARKTRGLGSLGTIAALPGRGGCCGGCGGQDAVDERRPRKPTTDGGGTKLERFRPG